MSAKFRIKVTTQGEIILTVPASVCVLEDGFAFAKNILTEGEAQKMAAELIKACGDSKQVNKLLKQIQGTTKDYNCSGKIIEIGESKEIIST